MDFAYWLNEHLIDVLATAWFFICWIGYSEFSRKRAKKVHCLSSVLQQYRKQWILRMLRRDNRIGDVAIIANLERNASFLASTSILVIAGLVTAVASTDKIHVLLTGLPFSEANISPLQLQFKILLLLFVHVFAFFTFTWSMRQYGFSAILLGSTPMHDEDTSNDPSNNFAFNFAKVIDQAGHSYNYGLRAYYFSMAILAWLFNTWLFLLAVAFVVAILYAREFHSKTLKTMIRAGELKGQTQALK
ncbi:Uncharacterized membrane protein [Alteromonadaceae bacterium Bs31]|nr:Uncharacterized membrane protein [Alteromonadaceae bacterium Bs31]